MADVPTKIVVDLSKPKGQRESTVPLTKAEIAERDATRIEYEAEQAERKAIAEQKETDAQAGREALIALGLTQAQVVALVGAAPIVIDPNLVIPKAGA
tara:strand:+ start:1036 stop:1329 length:294 start_codon:yes stop_codon:yes gene_type:complete